MTTEELYPTSFRFTEDELGLLDELAHLIATSHGYRIPISRRTAVMVAVDRALDDYRNGKGSVVAIPA